MPELKIIGDIVIHKVSSQAGQHVAEGKVLQYHLDPTGTQESHLVTDYWVRDRRRIDRRNRHSVAKHRDMRPPLEYLVRRMDDRFLDVIPRCFAVWPADEPHIFQWHFHCPLLDK